MNNILNLPDISLKSTKAALLSSIKFTNIHTLPKLKGIILSINIASADSENEYYIENLNDDISIISDQNPIYSFAKKSSEKLNRKKGMIISMTVILRKTNMLTFLTNLIKFSLKNVRDFDGFFIDSFDKHGNYTFSNINRLAFNEIEFNENFRKEKFNITINIVSPKLNNNLLFLKFLGLPFKLKKFDLL